jgi:hypothetical protein
MRKLACSLAVAIAVMVSPAAMPAASAQNWGCSTEKCLASCQKAGGKNCSFYCDQKIREKQQAKACK